MMPQRAVREVVRFPDIAAFDVERVWADAKRLLVTVGIEVHHPRLVKAAQKGLQVSGSRIYFAEEACEAMCSTIRSKAGQPDQGEAPAIDIFNNGVHFRYLDPGTSEERPWTTAALREHFKFIRQLGQEGVFHGGMPGYPHCPRLPL